MEDGEKRKDTVNMMRDQKTEREREKERERERGGGGRKIERRRGAYMTKGTYAK